MSNWLKVYLKSAGTRIAERMVYKWDYLISLFAMFFVELSFPIFVYIVYLNTAGFNGWNFYEILLIQGIYLIVKGISWACFFGITYRTIDYLETGKFDILLIKPRKVLFNLICMSFDAEDIAKFFGGLIISIYALVHLPAINFINYIYMIIIMFFGICFYFAIAVFFSGLIIRFIKTYRVYDFLEIVMIGLYPKTIYSKTIGAVFTGLIPVFIIALFPVQALLGKLNFIDLLISIISVAIILLLALRFWNNALKKYNSSGG
ncbi:MAG: ABC-2 family transporter protein [archaeon]